MYINRSEAVIFLMMRVSVTIQLLYCIYSGDIVELKLVLKRFRPNLIKKEKMEINRF